MQHILSHAPYKILFCIFILALFLRVWEIDHNPPGFFADEAANGYIAYSLLTTGHDDHGKLLPAFFQSFGDYRTPIAIYSMVPVVSIFGLNEFSVRLSMGLYGSLTVFILFFLVKILLAKTIQKHASLAALFAALLVSTSPWHIHFSRTGFEYIPFLFFLLLSWLFFIQASDKKISFLYPGICFGLTLYTYYPTFLQTPLFALVLFLLSINFWRNNGKQCILFMLSFLLTSSLFFYGLTNGELLTRFQSVSRFDKEQVSSWQLFDGYIRHFSIDFLFTKGDIGLPRHFITRHSVRNVGELFVWQAPFILIGIFYVIFKPKPSLIPILVLLLIYPLGSIVTPDPPFANRSIVGIIPLTILSTIGIAVIINMVANRLAKSLLLPKKILVLLIVLLFMPLSIEFMRYYGLYSQQYPAYAADYWGWQYGPRDIMRYFLAHQRNYDEFYMQGEFNAPEIFLQFYDPTHICKTCFIGSPKERYNPAKKQLFAVTPAYLKESTLPLRIINSIYYPDGSAAFHLVKVN